VSAGIKGASADLVIFDEVRRARPPVREHRPADHLSFLNADGSRSRICICPCDTCWASDGAECPDWNDKDV
jgi:hypothetical protein